MALLSPHLFFFLHRLFKGRFGLLVDIDLHCPFSENACLITKESDVLATFAHYLVVADLDHYAYQTRHYDFDGNFNVLKR